MRWGKVVDAGVSLVRRIWNGRSRWPGRAAERGGTVADDTHGGRRSAGRRGEPFDRDADANPREFARDSRRGSGGNGSPLSRANPGFVVSDRLAPHKSSLYNFLASQREESKSLQLSHLQRALLKFTQSERESTHGFARPRFPPSARIASRSRCPRFRAETTHILSLDPFTPLDLLLGLLPSVVASECRLYFRWLVAGPYSR